MVLKGLAGVQLASGVVHVAQLHHLNIHDDDDDDDDNDYGDDDADDDDDDDDNDDDAYDYDDHMKLVCTSASPTLLTMSVAQMGL